MSSSEASIRLVHTLYSDHQPWLLDMLRRKLGNVDNAADLAQDTFARILSSNESGPLREPRAYLTTVASRIAAQYFRRLALERTYLDAIAHLPEAVSPSPETRLLVLEALAAVSRVLDGLKPHVREIFLMAQLDGMTYPQIALQLQVSVNVVQKAMVKAYRHCYDAVYGE
ncbi:sigma-70 family RNA polymerase sigma factor [Variovorax sp. VaC1]|uniref:sigma-70 family RNA polymerase sigma factor n=1 Tax=Variovorax sp. VaC1 TaxID=3373132 RepID=UPI003747D404